MKLPDIATLDGRRAWAFAAIVGGCVVFTLFAAVGVYIVRDSKGLSFWLALAAHAQILVGMTAFSFLLGRRVNLKITKDGVEMDDGDEDKAEAKIEAAKP